MQPQKTIRASAHAIGVGVHTGNTVRMTLRPAEAGFGIRFVRTDVPTPTPVRAHAGNVSDTTLSTSIVEGGVQIATVEHLMSALWGLGIDNLLVELSGEEVPIMDGSAAPFISLIESVGLQNLPASRDYLRITRPIEVTQGDAKASLRPHRGFRASYTFVADHPVFNRYPKRAVVDFDQASFVSDISRARSFGLIEELPQAHAISRCLGSSTENAVAIDDRCIVNEEGLRYEDEFVKHKVLDAIGDLYLLGMPVLGEFEGYKSGHALNNKLARAVLRCVDAWETVKAPATPASREVVAPAAG